MDKKRLYKVMMENSDRDLDWFIVESKFNLASENQWYRVQKWADHAICPSQLYQGWKVDYVERWFVDGKI